MTLYMEKDGFAWGKRLGIKKPVDKSVETVDNFMHDRGVEKSCGTQFLRKRAIFPQNSSTGQNAQSVAKYR
jgi:hypothetical protein